MMLLNGPHSHSERPLMHDLQIVAHPYPTTNEIHSRCVAGVRTSTWCYVFHPYCALYGPSWAHIIPALGPIGAHIPLAAPFCYPIFLQQPEERQIDLLKGGTHTIGGEWGRGHVTLGPIPSGERGGGGPRNPEPAIYIYIYIYIS